MIVFNEAGPLPLMTLDCGHDQRSRTHLSHDRDTPIPPSVTSSAGTATAIPKVGTRRDHPFHRRPVVATLLVADRTVDHTATKGHEKGNIGAGR
jgi:hypothetical protein